MNLNHVNISGLRPIVGDGRKLYIETYGCQMNAGDSEVVLSILQGDGFRYTEDPAGADVILINTCSIRDNAEQRIWGRLRELRQYKKKNKGLLVGVIGCMAERLREKLIDQEELVNLVAGPDAYRDLPRLLREAGGGAKAVNVLLSGEETYAEISPVRLDKNGVSAYISIMRGCNNMCSYCVVPYTRGAERSRDPQTILREARELFDGGYREVTLLGQNVNSYRWENGETVAGFADLLGAVASVDPKLRVRFSTSHPKDLNRKYTREWYLGRIEAIRRILPGCSISTDLIAGFCTETDDDHRQTLSLMEEVGYASAFMFKYSERPNTKAARHMADDVPDGVKTARLNEIIALQNELSLRSNRLDVGREFEVLVEGVSKRSDRQLFGRTSQNKVVVFDRGDARVGDYVRVRVTDCSSATLHGQRVE